MCSCMLEVLTILSVFEMFELLVRIEVHAYIRMLHTYIHTHIHAYTQKRKYL
jgi:hypothetical protein